MLEKTSESNNETHPVLENPGSSSPEKLPLQEAENLTTLIEQDSDRFQTKTEEAVLSGLKSLKIEDPEIANEGKNISSTFAVKAGNLKNKFLGKMKIAMVALGLGGPLATDAGPKQNQEIKKGTIYVTDPSDPRLKAYQDSLRLYNEGEAFYDRAVNTKTVTDFVKYRDEMKSKSFGNWHMQSHIIPEETVFVGGDSFEPGSANNNKLDNYEIKHSSNSTVAGTSSNKKESYPPLQGDYKLVTDNSIYELERYAKPVNPVVFKEKPKQKLISMEIMKPDSLKTANPAMKISKVPFKEGSYFTISRDRQEQEIGNKQFGRKGLVDYYDKVTGKLLGTYPEGYDDGQ